MCVCESERVSARVYVLSNTFYQISIGNWLLKEMIGGNIDDAVWIPEKSKQQKKNNRI